MIKLNYYYSIKYNGPGINQFIFLYFKILRKLIHLHYQTNLITFNRVEINITSSL